MRKSFNIINPPPRIFLFWLSFGDSAEIHVKIGYIRFIGLINTVLFYDYTLIIHLLATENTMFQLYDNKLKHNREIHHYKCV